MQFKFFTVPGNGDDSDAERLNAFLRAHRVLSVRTEFVGRHDGPYWAVAVEYLDRDSTGQVTSGGKNRVDYREVLSETDFAQYSRLRELRKEIAAREAVPVYTIFTNDQLAEMVTGKVSSKTGLARITGVGKARIDSYGDEFLRLLSGGQCETGQSSDRENR